MNNTNFVDLLDYKDYNMAGNQTHNAFIEINKTNFINNLISIKKFVNHKLTNKKVLLCLPVKANAYGHDLIKTAIHTENYVDYFAVANLEEGIILRRSGIKKSILVFGAFTEAQIAGLIKYELDITISSLHKAQLVADFCVRNNLSCKIHIKIDTGMNRIGVKTTSAFALIDFICKQASFEVVGIYSHFVASDLISSNHDYDKTVDATITQQQLSLFMPVVDYIKKLKPNIIAHIANSGAVCYHDNTYLDMVRPGILSYGYLPNNGMHIDKYLQNNIKPCFTLKSKVVYFKVIAANSGISYNHEYYTKEQTRIVTIAIGYGDGYRLQLSNCGEVIIRGKKYTISGRICMDMLMVDIGMENSAYVGDEVVLIGKQGDVEITLQSVSDKLHTIIYEILCSFTSRIPRIYIENQ